MAAVAWKGGAGPVLGPPPATPYAPSLPRPGAPLSVLPPRSDPASPTPVLARRRALAPGPHRGRSALSAQPGLALSPPHQGERAAGSLARCGSRVGTQMRSGEVRVNPGASRGTQSRVRHGWLRARTSRRAAGDPGCGSGGACGPSMPSADAHPLARTAGPADCVLRGLAALHTEASLLTRSGWGVGTLPRLPSPPTFPLSAVGARQRS